jgi:hypothetical protein
VLLLLLTAAAIGVHGYHPFVEDGEIYVPGILRELHPALYPYNAAFFASHAHMTLFPELIAGSIRLTHVPFEWGLFGWHFFSIFLLLLGCWHVGRLAFGKPLAAWGSTALVASLLTIPVAGTALYLMDEYLTTRSLSAPAVIFLLVNTVEKKYVRAVLWAVFTAAIHPLMAVFGLSYAVLALWMQRRPAQISVGATTAALLFPLGLFPPVTGAYRQVLATRPYFFLWRWAWYEWLGLIAPMALLWWFARVARKQNFPVLDLLCRALLAFGAIFFIASAAITIPPPFARLAELQPMRYLHLLYILLFVFAGGLLAEFVLNQHLWRWLLLFVPLCGGMWFAQRQLFPDTPHIEWPDRTPGNTWAQAFVWVRQHTPINAYFALNPYYMKLPGEDQHGFRAIADRSALADRVKDSGAASMFPQLAGVWLTQVRALDGWKDFQLSDFRRLKQEFGVDWVVVEQPGVAGLNCPYQNKAVKICQID